MIHNTTPARISSGMRVTGKMHLGHYHGALKNWAKLQYEYDCFFFAADWHALTTHYDNPTVISENIWDMFIDWLAAGINPGSATLFIQSDVPEIAELHVLLSMATPLSWLERIPTFKDQQMNMQDKDLATYGFLGYPMLQSADVLGYKANFVPVGEDQASHVEFMREVARRFNFLYGREKNFEENAQKAIASMGKKQAKLYSDYRKAYQENGNEEALERAKALLDAQSQISYGNKERLLGYLIGSSKAILPEPQILLTETSKLTGLDGRKMSKSYNNTISLREKPKDIEHKIKTMPTDPARIKRSDPGDPEKCPVWSLHKVYSSADTKKWVQTGCKSAGIGCIECKQPVIEAIQKEIGEIRERAKEYEDDPKLVKNIVAQGAEKARDTVQETLKEVKEAMGLVY